MIDDPNQPQRGRMRSLLLILLLCIIVLGLIVFAWARNPPDTPNPSSTAFPDALPNGGAAPTQ